MGNLKKKIPNKILISVAAIVLAVITVGTFILTKQTGEYNQSFQNQSAGLEIILASLLFLIFKQNMNRPGRILDRVPLVPLSLSIYLMHNILLSMMYAVGFTVNSFTDTVVITLLNLLICLIVMKTVATVKPICYIATGMSYKSACNSCNWIYTYRWITSIKRKSLHSKT